MTLRDRRNTGPRVQARAQVRAGKHFRPALAFGGLLLAGALWWAFAPAALAQTPAPAAAERAGPAARVGAGPGSSASIAPNKTTNRDVDAAFDRADANGDGRLDRQEAEHLPAVAQRFELIDTNRDTFVSREELHRMAGS